MLIGKPKTNIHYILILNHVSSRGNNIVAVGIFLNRNPNLEKYLEFSSLFATALFFSKLRFIPKSKGASFCSSSWDNLFRSGSECQL